MAVSNLTNTTWVFNSSVLISDADHHDYNINFTSNNNQYIEIQITEGEIYGIHEIIYCTANSGTSVIDGSSPLSSWKNQAYRTIEVTGGTDVTNATLIAWLEANAVQQVSTVNIVLGTNTINGVDTIKVKDSVDSSVYRDFKYGTTPSTTTGIEVGGNTLTGVNSIVVKDTNNNNVTFGYDPPAPSGFNVTLDGTGHSTTWAGNLYGYAKIGSAPTAWNDYNIVWKCNIGASNTTISVDNQSTWSTTQVISNVDKLYCWAGYCDGSQETTATNRVKINNVDITQRIYSNAYELNVTQDSTFMVQGAWGD